MRTPAIVAWRNVAGHLKTARDRLVDAGELSGFALPGLEIEHRRCVESMKLVTGDLIWQRRNRRRWSKRDTANADYAASADTSREDYRSSGATLGPGGVDFIVMDAALAPGGRVPRTLVHTFSLSLDPEIPELAHVVRIGTTDVAGDHPVVVGPPLRGGRWVDVNGCCAELTAHRGAVHPVNGSFVESQRFRHRLRRHSGDASAATLRSPPTAARRRRRVARHLVVMPRRVQDSVNGGYSSVSSTR